MKRRRKGLHPDAFMSRTWQILVVHSFWGFCSYIEKKNPISYHLGNQRSLEVMSHIAVLTPSQRRRGKTGERCVFPLVQCIREGAKKIHVGGGVLVYQSECVCVRVCLAEGAGECMSSQAVVTIIPYCLTHPFAHTTNSHFFLLVNTPKSPFSIHCNMQCDECAVIITSHT